MRISAICAPIWIVTQLFHLGLPLLMNGYLWDPVGVKLVNRFSNIETLEEEAKRFQDLIREVAANPKNCAVQNFIKVQSSASMNYVFYEYYREEEIPASLSRMLFGLARLRMALLRKLGWRGWIRFSQQRAFLKDVFRGLFLLLFRGTKLRASRLVRRMFPSREMGSARTGAAPPSAETVKNLASLKSEASVDSASSLLTTRSSPHHSEIS
jgi:hypothetical protein